MKDNFSFFPKVFIVFFLLLNTISISTAQKKQDTFNSLKPFSFTSIKNQIPNPAQRNCGTDDYLTERLSNDPAFAKRFYDLTNMAKQKVNPKMLSCTGSNSVIIPIAIHFGSGVDCTSPACLIGAAEAQVQVLNEDFGASNSDLSYYTSTLNGICPAAYPLSYASVPNSGSCIQFCLASRNHPASSGLDEGQPAITVGEETWPNAGAEWSGYLNIFVSDGSDAGLGGLLGISPVPGSADGDGFWVTSVAFGGPGYSCNSGGPINTSNTYDLGRTATHEAGHYFGLYHTFQGGCNDGDSSPPGPVPVNDTPAHSNSTSGCPNVTSCGSAPTQCGGEYTPFYNYMDYSADACLVMFSEHQSQVINYWGNQNTWKSESIACNGNDVFTDLGTCILTPPVANFSPKGSTTLCTGSCINFIDISTGDQATSWLWNFSVTSGDIVLSDNTSTNENPEICILSGNTGVMSISLTVSNGAGNSNITSTLDIIIDQDCDNGCLLLSNVDVNNDNLVVYESNNTGYVAGSNGYNDVSKADYFDLSNFNFCYPSSLTGVNLLFGVVDPSTTGTLTVVLWDDTGAGGSPGNIMASISLSVSVIIDDVMNEVATFIDFGSAPVLLTGPFYVGITGLNNLSGGDLSLVTNTDGESSPNTAWEEFSDGVWHAYNEGSSWGLDISHAIFPEILPEPPSPAIVIPSSTLCNTTAITFADNTPDLCSGTVPTYAWAVTGQSNGAITPAINTSSSATPSFEFPTVGIYNLELCVTGAVCERTCTSAVISIEDCCTETLSLPDDLVPGITLSNGIYNADLWVKSTSTIPDGTNVTYQGGNYVELLVGHEVEMGAEFLAENVDCGNFTVVPMLLQDEENILTVEKMEDNFDSQQVQFFPFLSKPVIINKK